VGNSTALGVLVADALVGEGMQLAGDPVDIGVTASPEDFGAAVAAALGPAEGGVDAGAGAADALVAVFVPPIATPGNAYARALREAAAGIQASADKPVVAVFFAAEGVPAELAVLDEDGTPVRGSVPSYASPERAAAALARVSRYAAWRAEPAGDFTPPPDIDGDAARALVDRLASGAAVEADGTGPSAAAASDAAAAGAAADGDAMVGGEPIVGGRLLDDEEAAELLACYGITLVESRRVADAEATAAAAEELGYPVAVKAVGDRWRHRTDHIGVRLDVVTPAGARRAFTDLTQLSGHGEVDVQRMASKGVACVLEIVEDTSFGSLISFGLAGTATALLGDRAFRVVPVSDRDAAALVRAPRAAPLLDGYRGAEPTDLAAMEELVRRVGKLAEDLPEVRALTLEPVLATATGVSVVGARVVLGQPPRRDDTGPRRMR
jgi:acyl-CoA synthetase (NDP forming)